MEVCCGGSLRLASPIAWGFSLGGGAGYLKLWTPRRVFLRACVCVCDDVSLLLCTNPVVRAREFVPIGGGCL